MRSGFGATTDRMEGCELTLIGDTLYMHGVALTPSQIGVGCSSVHLRVQNSSKAQLMAAGGALAAAGVEVNMLGPTGTSDDPNADWAEYPFPYPAPDDPSAYTPPGPPASGGGGSPYTPPSSGQAPYPPSSLPASPSASSSTLASVGGANMKMLGWVALGAVGLVAAAWLYVSATKPSRPGSLRANRRKRRGR